ncbi:hypothetical protein BH11MYX2_BH11MYX2_15960 [soil metagenome]
MVHAASRLGSCLALALLVIAARAPRADAFSACTDNAAWVSPGATLPPHGRVVYYSDSGHGEVDDTKLVATINKKPVKTKITHVASAPYELTLVEIDSDKTGTLSISFGNRDSSATYKIARKVDMPKEIKGKTTRFGRAYQHSTVHEAYDGLAIVLPAGTPAITAHVKVRRDSKADWAELDVPLRPDDATRAPSVWIGELGCVRNYTPALLEACVDIEVVLTLVDGSTRKVSLPAHVVLRKP